MKKWFENTGNSPMYVGGVMIPPGEQTMVEVPDEPLEAPDEHTPTLAELVAEELKKPVKELVPFLPTASADALDMMATLEGAAAKPRTSLLDAIAAEVVTRADAALKAGNKPD